MKQKVILVYLLLTGLIPCSCIKEEPYFCGRILVVIEEAERPLGYSPNFRTKIWSYQSPDIKKVRSFEDYVMCEKNRIGEPSLSFYELNNELICTVPLEDCICSKTVFYPDDRFYTLVFLIRVQHESIIYPDETDYTFLNSSFLR